MNKKKSKNKLPLLNLNCIDCIHQTLNTKIHNSFHSPKTLSEIKIYHQSRHAKHQNLDNTVHEIGNDIAISSDIDSSFHKEVQSQMTHNHQKYSIVGSPQKMTTPKILNLCNTGLKEFPQLQKDPNNGNHQFKEISKSEYYQVSTIRLDNNLLTNISSFIENFTNLEELSATCNYISNIPKEIGQLRSLRILKLSQNRLDFIPMEIGNLINLRSLELIDNFINRVPTSMHRLQSLEHISLEWFYYTTRQRICSVLDADGPYIKEFISILKDRSDSAYINFVQYFIDSMKLSEQTILSIKYDSKERNVLHLAAIRGHIAIVKTLIAYNINVNSQDKEGSTALLISLLNKRFKIAKVLISSSVIDPTIQNSKMESPLIISVLSCYLHLTESMLAKCVPPIDFKDEFGNTMAHLIFRNFKVEDDISKRLIHKLIFLNANMNAYNEGMLTPFLYAIKKNQHHAVKLCFDINKQERVFTETLRGRNGMTALHYSAIYSDIPMIQLLLSNGLDPLETDNQKFTCSHYACNPSIRKYLILIEHERISAQIRYDRNKIIRINKYNIPTQKIRKLMNYMAANNDNTAIDYYEVQEGFNKNLKNMKQYTTPATSNFIQKTNHPIYLATKAMPNNKRKAYSKDTSDTNDGLSSFRSNVLNERLHPKSMSSDINEDEESYIVNRVSSRCESRKSKENGFSARGVNSESPVSNTSRNPHQKKILFSNFYSFNNSYKVLVTTASSINCKYRALFEMVITQNEDALRNVLKAIQPTHCILDVIYCLTLLSTASLSTVIELLYELIKRSINSKKLMMNEIYNMAKLRHYGLFAFNEWYLLEKTADKPADSYRQKRTVDFHVSMPDHII